MSETIGLLHYHFRDPQITAQRALTDLKAFKGLPQHASLHNISEYRHKLVITVKHHGFAHHKASELLAYIDYGLEGVLNVSRSIYPTKEDIMLVGNIT